MSTDAAEHQQAMKSPDKWRKFTWKKCKIFIINHSNESNEYIIAKAVT